MFLVYGLIGLYIINSAFGFVPIPSFVQEFDKWVIAVGGVLLIVGGVLHLKPKNKGV